MLADSSLNKTSNKGLNIGPRQHGGREYAFVKKILLVQQDRRLSGMIADMLRAEGFEVQQLFSGDEVSDEVKSYRPELIVLDVLLPGKCGFTLCRELRRYFHGRLLILSDKSAAIDQVLGLEMGADAYVVKPVSLRVLLARINVLFRWQSQRRQLCTPQKISDGSLSLCPLSRQVSLSGQEIQLTGQEFDLLWLLASRAGKIQSRNVLYQQVAGRNYDGLDRSIDVRISRLRKKLQDDLARPFRIKTVRGKGYLLVPGVWG